MSNNDDIKAQKLPEYHLRHGLEQAFDRLMDTLEHVVNCFDQGPQSVWRFEGSSRDSGFPGRLGDPTAWLRHALLDMWHEQGQDGRETRNYIGLIAADNTLLAAVNEANQAKTELATCLQRIKAHSLSMLGDVKGQLTRRHPDVEQVLEQTGLARLHLKQCWRKLPVAEAPVSRVRFAWYSSGRSIKKLSVRDAEQKLLTFDSEADHIRIQLRKLAGLPSSEVLAQVQDQAPLMRANLFYTDPLKNGQTRTAFNAAMPIFVPSNDGRLPHTNQPNPTPPETRTRARRRDEKLESDVFLPSLRVFRYR